MILDLKQNLEAEIKAGYGRRTRIALALLDKLLERPVVRRRDVHQWTGLSEKAANDLVNFFVEDRYLKEVTGRQRNQIFIFEPLMRLFDR